MSNETKKSGARDISDLKARLGLKKGEGTGGRPGVTTGSAAVPPPAGARLTGAFVPPPPGVAPPQPAAPPQPVVPDARVDPFGAMNAMAAHGAVAAQPEIIVVNDGKPVESVQNKSKATRYLKTALAIIVPLAIGFIIGGINYERADVNRTIASAGVIKTELATLSTKINGLKDVLLTAKENSNGNFKPNDAELTKTLKELNFAVGDEEKLIIYHAHLFKMDPQLVDDTLDFYSNIQSLSKQIADHVKASEYDAQKAKPEALKPLLGEGDRPVPLAGIVRMPKPDQKGAVPMIEIVQLGAPVCTVGGPPAPDGCPGGAPPAGFQFRPDPSGPWGSKEFAATEVAADRIIAVGDSGVLNAFQKGSQQYVDTVNYMTRITNIDSLTNTLIEQKKSIDDRMNALAQRSPSMAIGD